MTQEVATFLAKKFSGVLAKVEVVKKEDLDLVRFLVIVSEIIAVQYLIEVQTLYFFKAALFTSLWLRGCNVILLHYCTTKGVMIP